MRGGWPRATGAGRRRRGCVGSGGCRGRRRAPRSNAYGCCAHCPSWLRGRCRPGMVLVRGQLDPEGGAALATALDALMRPPGCGDARSATQRRADALVELARGALREGRTPTVAGMRPQVAVLLTPPTLTGRPGWRSMG